MMSVREHIEILDGLRKLCDKAAVIFTREPDDAADYKDASEKIYTVWRFAKEIKEKIDKQDRLFKVAIGTEVSNQ